MSDTRRRFLCEIAERLDREQVVEVHLFHPLRHDGRETGVAVIAVEPASPPTMEPGGESDPQLDGVAAGADNAEDGAEIIPHAEARGKSGLSRHIVYRALYRHTLKGAERGKWEFELVAEADAPLLAVDDVVRGVHRRVGEDVAPVRLNGAAFRAALAEVRWSASAR